jgi:hypothetical protein
MAFYNRRLARDRPLADGAGDLGPENTGRYFGFISYELNRRLLPRVVGQLFMWMLLEAREGWRTWFSVSPRGGRRAVPAPAAVKT